jgi:chromosome segregation ATPase
VCLFERRAAKQLSLVRRMEEVAESCMLSLSDSGTKRKHVDDDDEIAQSPKSLRPGTFENTSDEVTPQSVGSDVTECEQSPQQAELEFAEDHIHEMSEQANGQERSGTFSEQIQSHNEDDVSSSPYDSERLEGNEFHITTVENLKRYCSHLQHEQALLQQQLAETTAELEQRRTDQAGIPRYKEVMGEIMERLQDALKDKAGNAGTTEGTVSRLFERLKTHCNSLLIHRDGLRSEATVLRRELRRRPKQEEQLTRIKESHAADLRKQEEKHAAALMTAAKVASKLRRSVQEKNIAMRNAQREYKEQLTTRDGNIVELTERCTNLTTRLNVLLQQYSSLKELSDVQTRIGKIKDARILDLEGFQAAVSATLSSITVSTGPREARTKNEGTFWQLPVEFSKIWRICRRTCMSCVLIVNADPRG